MRQWKYFISLILWNKWAVKADLLTILTLGVNGSYLKFIDVASYSKLVA
jgi:hypothetical protein